MAKLTDREIKNAELTILKQFAEFCEDKSLRYSLAYGTLIGAVRHKGFIPWDDDIDVIMPRPDYDEFITLVSEGAFPSSLVVSSTELDGAPQPFAKVVNPQIKVVSGRDREDIDERLWIDVFPIDGLPSSNIKCCFIFFLAKVFGQLSVISLLDHKYDHPGYLKIAIVLLSPISRIVPFEKWSSRVLHWLNRRITFGSSDYAGLIGWGSGVRERFPVEYFTDLTTASFEGSTFNIPRHYDEMLRSIYGDDYMQLPPEEKRVTHALSAWTID